MRRVTKKLLVFSLGLAFTVLYCEFIIYYVVISQCSWPLPMNVRGQVLKAFILADTHLLGPFHGHWVDKMRREWQMHQAFKAIINFHNPDVVFVLGDLFDEGEWTNNRQFEEYVQRFYKLFPVPSHIKMFVVAGNHDIGFHNNIRKGSHSRFVKILKAPAVQLLTLKDSHFVLLNSMAMEGDSCSLCLEARREISKISDTLSCSEHPDQCSNRMPSLNYSRPILLQHFPLYRLSDMACTEPDSAPLSEKRIRFRLTIEALTEEATDYLVTKLKPRAVFGGHTHHGCRLFHNHDDIEFYEYSVPSFSWRNRLDPKYMLVSITPDSYEVNKCGLPRETTIVFIAVGLFVFNVLFILQKNIGHDYLGWNDIR